MMNKIFQPTSKRIPWMIVALVAALSLGFYSFHTARAAASLTIVPITWNVMGLDSNNVNVGPSNFPVGVRVCNVGDAPATNVASAFVWDSADPYIDLRTGSKSSYTLTEPLSNVAPNNCVDFYYEVSITRNSAAYNHTRRYHITASANSIPTVSTVTPREVFVEHLVSQSRNSNFALELNGTPIPAGGEMNLYVGQTYTIKLGSYTATNGYEQIETFINFPNTIFQVLSVVSTYSATSGGGITPTDKLYNDACTWVNDPNDPNYRSCVTVGKAGGTIYNTYTIKIIGGGGTRQTLTNLIYDFSGSSYHYNSDYTTSARFGNIIDPTSLTMAKSFVPATTNTGGVSALTITIYNPNTAALSGLNFTDPLPTTPGAMLVASQPNATTSGCGTPTFNPAAGASSLSFSNGAIAANGYCVIKVNVTVPAAGIYTNTTNHLFIGSVDTGKYASANLTVNTDPPQPAPTCGIELAFWNFTGTTSLTPPSYLNPRVSTATASYAGTGSSVVGSALGNPVNAWGVTSGWASSGIPTGNAAPYFQFLVDTGQFTNVQIRFDYNARGNWAGSSTNTMYVFYNKDGSTFTALYNTLFDNGLTAAWVTSPVLPPSNTPTGTSTTAFRIIPVGQQSTTAVFYLDNITIYGCAVPLEPTLTKTFSSNPVAVGSVSRLVFTLTNVENIPLTGVTFTDALPAGLQVAGTPNATTTCFSAINPNPTWAPTAGATTHTFGSPNGGTIPARVGSTNGTCTVEVNIVATTAGPHQNVSGFVYTTQTGTNNTTTGYGAASLTAILPPVISKRFFPNPVILGQTSTLAFEIKNPNSVFALTGVQFSDAFPSNLVVANPPNASTLGCGSPAYSPTAGAISVAFSGGTIAAGGTCYVYVNVTASAAGSYPNTTGAVSANITGPGNTASNTLLVQSVTPAISLLKRIGASASGPWYSNLTVASGGQVWYRFIVENTGDVNLTNVSLSDPALTGFNPASCTWLNGNGAPLTYPLSLPVAGLDAAHLAVCVYGPVTAAVGVYSNTATASVTYGGNTYTDASTAMYGTPALTIDKTVVETAYTGVGDVLYYNFLITNSGSTTLRAPITVNDPKITPVSCPPLNTVVPDGDNYLDMGESILCSGTYVVTQADIDNGSIANTAFARATWTTSENVTDSNNDTVVINRSPADYGDLPSSALISYSNTYQAQNGSRHTIDTLFIGKGVTADSDGNPNDTATGETDTIDDGVIRGGESWIYGAPVTLKIDLLTSTFSDPVVAGIWIDWDSNRVFDPATDFFPCTGLTTGGVRSCSITVPAYPTYTVGNPLFVRVRVFDSSRVPGGTLDASDYQGLANNGEVEDYKWEFGPTVVEMIALDARTNPSGLLLWAWLSAAALVSTGGLLTLRATRRRR